MPRGKYWKKAFGVDLFKIEWYAKYFLYRYLGLTLPKLADQRAYWEDRGRAYYDEFTRSNYQDREVFFQDLLIDALKEIEFDSAFEAGCGFGWNIRRIREDFPRTRVGGLDFSRTQLHNALGYMKKYSPALVCGDACRMPFRDNAFDVGFTVGVFMNIHPRKIRAALLEMKRVSRKYIIHLEYDENHTTDELREKRAFKTNIVSHDYRKLYSEIGARVVRFETYRDFGERFQRHMREVETDLDRWEGFEGPEKYILIVVRV